MRCIRGNDTACQCRVHISLSLSLSLREEYIHIYTCILLSCIRFPVRGWTWTKRDVLSISVGDDSSPRQLLRYSRGRLRINQKRTTRRALNAIPRTKVNKRVKRALYTKKVEICVYTASRDETGRGESLIDKEVAIKWIRIPYDLSLFRAIPPTLDKWKIHFYYFNPLHSPPYILLLLYVYSH